jgi:hypothetical protein
MSKSIFIFLLYFAINIQPSFAQNQALDIDTHLVFHSKHFLGLQNDLRSADRGIAKFDINYDTDNSLSKIALNYDGYSNFTFDRSFLQYTSGIATLGVGAIDRHWSFSDKSSLILSHNARPFKSIYLRLKNEFEYNWMPSKANWSLEVFNGLTKGSLNGSKSMLLGARAVLSPIKGLDIELVQTSQWGGNGYDDGVSALGAALIFDTNENTHSNINKMAGFGISYLIPIDNISLRVYGQTIGEDEAGSLPSCLSYLAGVELSNDKLKYPITVGIEALDTRVDKSKNGNCGPNTMYNNNVYSYTNNSKVMGAAIDTEGASIGLNVQSKISQKININFAVKSAIINNNNWSDHRLSSKRQSGLINSLGVSWSENNISFNGNIYNQSFSLDKASINSGYGVGFSTSITF